MRADPLVRIELSAAPIRWALGALMACALLLLGTAPVWALDAPPLERRVTDTAELLAPDARDALEQRLASYETKTGHQYAVLTVPSLEGDAIEDYSMRAAERWKLGSKARDDGLLLLVVKNDRKVRVEVGRGLEGAVTDAFTARVIRNIIAPAFRAGDYPSGIEQGLDALMKQGAGEAVDPGPPAPSHGQRGEPQGGVPLVLLFFLVPLLIAFASRRGGGRRRGGFFVGGFPMGFGGGGRGGGFGGGGGGGGFGGGGGSFGGGGSSGSW